MDITFIALYLLGGMSGFKAAAPVRSCVEDLAAIEYTDCLMGYLEFLDSVIVEKNASPHLMMTTICGKEGDAKRACINTYNQQCPELDMPIETNTKNVGKIAPKSSMMARINATCFQLEGGKCDTLMTCLNESTSEDSFKTKDREGHSGTFGATLRSLPRQIGILCGPLKGQLACLDDAPADCSDLATSIKEQITAMVSREMGTMSDPLEDSKQYIKEQCPKVAEDFPTDKCVKRILKSRDFQDCVTKVYRAFAKDGFNGSCELYTKGKKCLDEHMGETCGQASADTVIMAVPFFKDAIPVKCYQKTSGSEGIQASMSTLIMLMLYTTGRVVLEIN